MPPDCIDLVTDSNSRKTSVRFLILLCLILLNVTFQIIQRLFWKTFITSLPQKRILKTKLCLLIWPLMVKYMMIVRNQNSFWNFYGSKKKLFSSVFLLCCSKIYYRQVEIHSCLQPFSLWLASFINKHFLWYLLSFRKTICILYFMKSFR